MWTMDTLEPEICGGEARRDSRGRRTVKAEERGRLLAEYARSALTQKRFCEQEGLNYHTFVAWLAQQRREKAQRAEPPRPRFHELVLGSGGGDRRRGACALEVQLPGGEVIRGEEPEAVARLVSLLRG